MIKKRRKQISEELDMEHYQLPNRLDQESFIISQNQRQGGRTEKINQIARKGEKYSEAYKAILKEHDTP